MEFVVTGPIFQWRGPAPFYYVAMAEEDSADLRADAAMLTYGWGVIPVRAHVGETVWQTSLFPKDDLYLVPFKDAVRRAEGLGDGDVVTVVVTTG